MRTTLTALGLAVLAAAAGGCGGGGPAPDEAPPVPEADVPALADAVVGTWELASVELRDAAGALLPAPEGPVLGAPGAIGQLVLGGAGHVGLAIMQQNRPRYEEATPEQALADVEGYTAFFGTYAVDETAGLLTVEIAGSRDPRLTGASHAGAVEAVADRLTLELPASAAGVTPTTVWSRLPDRDDLTSAQRRVIGFWRHVPNEGAAADDPPLRPGFIIYTAAGRMMVHLLDPERAAPAGGEPTAEEAQAAVGSYTSYFGPFSADEEGGYFVHHRIGHTLDLTDRSEAERTTGLGTDAQRFHEFAGGRMVLRFLSTAGIMPAPADGEAEWRGTITWERLTPAPGQGPRGG